METRGGKIQNLLIALQQNVPTFRILVVCVFHIEVKRKWSIVLIMDVNPNIC
jgi:hypothetical protein